MTDLKYDILILLLQYIDLFACIDIYQNVLKYIYIYQLGHWNEH